jgi:hypothetical protein
VPQNITICNEINFRLTWKTKKRVMTWVTVHGQNPNKMVTYLDTICVTLIMCLVECVQSLHVRMDLWKLYRWNDTWKELQLIS